MSNPYIGEIRMFAGNFAPAGWAFCNGQTLPISENDALFTLIGTTYGGDGQETFNLPDLTSRLPMHQGQGPGLTNRVIGEMAGTETVTLTVQQIPIHSHPPVCSLAPGNQRSPVGNVWASSAERQYTKATLLDISLVPSTAQPVGGSQPHENMSPFVGINFIISLFGIFPSQT